MGTAPSSLRSEDDPAVTDDGAKLLRLPRGKPVPVTPIPRPVGRNAAAGVGTLGKL